MAETRKTVFSFFMLLALSSVAFAQCQADSPAAISNLSTSNYTASQGDMIGFSFVLSANQKQINNGAVRVQIRYMDGWSAVRYYPVIDDFYLGEKANLKKGSSQNFSFEWKVPDSASSGFYQADLYLYEGQFQVGDSPLMPQPSLVFEVLEREYGMSARRAYFDTDGIRISGKPGFGRMGSLDTAFEDGEAIYVEVPIINEGPERGARVAYELFDWEEMKNEQLLGVQEGLSGPLLSAVQGADKSGSEFILLPANGTRLFWFEFGQLPPATYLTKLTLEWEDSKEFLYIPIRIRGEKADFSYAGLSDFPIAAGQNATVDLCFQLSAPEPADSANAIPAKIRVELGDGGNLLLEGIYDVNLSSSPASLSVPFSPQTLFTKGKLRAEIFSASGLLDSVSVDFDYSEYYGTKKLSLSTSQWEGGASYIVKLHDDLGFPLGANATLYVINSSDMVVESRNLQFTGEISGYLELEPGQYWLRITTASGLSQAAGVSVPSRQKPPEKTDPTLFFIVAILAIAALLAWRLRRK
ncbi:MAG: hypothetical protein NT157_04010 [Candidatus Micrarchaeota archaeon]|nr:hypothetical protein [Candidatus Micrarchaeota archaeon]